MAFESLAPAFARLAHPRNHIVDRLIAERAPKLASNPAWPVLRTALYAILDYGKARRMADAIAPMGGRAAIDHLSDLLSVRVTARGLDRVPRSGRLVVVCNHPTGIADGVAVYDALKPLRPELMFYANADAHRVCPRFDEILIPVEWVEAKRTRDRTRLTLAMTREAMEAERALVIFPAGRLARWSPTKGMADPVWASSAFSVARKYEAPILPIHVDGPTSRLFHLFHQFSGELRDMTLFHELLNKRRKAFRLTVGPPIPHGALPADAGDAALAMKTYVETILAAHPDRPFR
jgi:putative hemolysin